MNYFSKKLFDKLKVYYFYYIKKKSRKFFFILVWRKVFNILNKNSREKYTKDFVSEWCKKKIISEHNFYRKIGLKYSKNFFDDKKSYYLQARIKERNLKYKMGGMAHLNLIYNLNKHLMPKKILETGVAFGWSTLVFVLSKSNQASLTSIDLSYPTSSSDKFVALAVPSHLKKKFKLLKGIDNNFLKLFKQKNFSFDFIHYDSDKSYIGRKKNYDLIWQILKKKGCFVSDDISDNSAFYEFVVSKKIKYYIIKSSSKYVGVVFK